MRSFDLFSAFLGSLFAFSLQAYSASPPSFPYLDGRAVYADFISEHLELTFDVPKQKAFGNALVVFKTQEDGFPILDLVPNPIQIFLDDIELDVRDFILQKAPGGETKFRIIKEKVTADTIHELKIRYVLNDGISFTKNSAKAGFFADDLKSGGRGFWEQYAPSGFEHDAFGLSINLKVLGDTQEHILFTNGKVQADPERNRWNIEFPDYFTTSSFYLHLGERTRFSLKRDEYQGISGRLIPIRFYAETEHLASAGLQVAMSTFYELEHTYGEYAHPNYTGYITAFGGGMEYCGATVSSLDALEHEITHSWFARGVMPANGNAGWVDEAVASWRDNGYDRTPFSYWTLERNLGGFTPYKRETTEDAYTAGAGFIAALDHEFRSIKLEGQSGMRAILADYYSKFKWRTFSNKDFQTHLENLTGRNLTELFDRYVYAKTPGVKVKNPGESRFIQEPRKSKHPRKFSPEELRLIL